MDVAFMTSVSVRFFSLSQYVEPYGPMLGLWQQDVNKQASVYILLPLIVYIQGQKWKSVQTFSGFFLQTKRGSKVIKVFKG